jgi:hypothetical protein
MSNLQLQASTFESALRDRVRGMVMDMIPDEAVDRVIKEVATDFMNKGVRGVIEEELTTYYKNAIKEYLSQPEWVKWWQSGQPFDRRNEAYNPMPHQADIPDKVKELMVQIAPEMFGSIFLNFGRALVESLRNGGTYYRP